jgi:hypothetical protein
MRMCRDDNADGAARHEVFQCLVPTECIRHHVRELCVDGRSQPNVRITPNAHIIVGMMRCQQC